MKLTASNEVMTLLRDYARTKRGKSVYAAAEKEAKERLLAQLGYHPDDEKPAPCEIVDPDGVPLAEVKVGQRKGLDLKYLREKYPEIYAECERWTYPISIRPVASTSGTAD